MAVYTTEIASENISSDNPIHQRLLKPYFVVKGEVRGDVLEIGCGEGRGVDILLENASSFTAIDKIQEVVDNLQSRYPDGNFLRMSIPPFAGLEDNTYDFIVSFQVIEHIKDDVGYLKEIYRVLKPGGKAVITTPNIKKTLTRNPWHIREYTASELTRLASGIFEKVNMMGIAGNKKVMEYYERNKASVKKFTRWDIFDLQHNLPSFVLKIPYDILNRMNRNRLEKASDSSVSDISYRDYIEVENADEALDLMLWVEKD